MPEKEFMNFRPGEDCARVVHALLESGEYATRTELLRDAVKCLAQRKKVRV